MTIRVLLADDHKLMRRALGRQLDHEEGILVVAEADDGREAVRLAIEQRPDVVIMDISMPGLNGVDAARQIVSKAPNVRVLALSAHVDQQHVSSMLDAGARGYLAKDCETAELVEALQRLAAGKVYLGAGVADVVVDDYVKRLDDGTQPKQALTSREREVLQLLAEGKSTKEIAGLLDLSSKTIDTHRANIMSKLGLHSIAELTKYAIREGLTSIDL
jgi:DNA-binding NarL/FixJ family response regulator